MFSCFDLTTLHKKNLIAAVTLGLFLAACSSNENDAEIVNARTPSSYHIVKKGESIEAICARYKISKADLIAINSLKPPYKLFAKQRIRVKSIKSQEGQYYASGDDIVVKNIDDELPKLPDNAMQDHTKEQQNNDHALPMPGAAETGTGTPVLGENVLTEQTTPSQAQQSETTSAFYQWPVQGKVLQSFGQKAADGTIQESVSIQAPAGTKVKSVAQGEVLRAGRLREIQEWGNVVIIKQKDGRVCVYGFLKEVYAKKGQAVSAGDVIGTVGVNKAKNKAMLVFQMRAKKGGKLITVDPMSYFEPR